MTRMFLCIVIAVGVIPCITSTGQETGLSFVREAAFVSANEIRVQVTITGDEDTISSLKALGFQERFPTAWSYTGEYEEYYGDKTFKEEGEKGVGINANILGQLDFYWIQIPEFPITIVYGLTAPSYETGQSISGILYWFSEFEDFFLTTPVTYPDAFEGEGEVIGEGEGELVEGEGELPVEGEVETGSLRGVVRKAGTIEVLSGAEVKLLPGDYTAISNTLGVFALLEVPVGEYTLTATKSGYEKYSATVTISTGLAVHDVALISIETEGELQTEGEGETEGELQTEGEGEIEGEAQTGSLSGTVSNANNGLPLYGAQLLLMPGSYGTTTDRQGIYNFTELPTGAYILTTTLSGYTASNIGVNIAAGANTQDVALSHETTEGENVSEGEGEGESESEGEGEVSVDDYGCCSSSKGIATDWQRYLGDLFLVGITLLVLSRLNVR